MKTMMLQAFNRQFDFGRYEISRVCYLSEHGRCGVTETKGGENTAERCTTDKFKGAFWVLQKWL